MPLSARRAGTRLDMSGAVVLFAGLLFLIGPLLFGHDVHWAPGSGLVMAAGVAILGRLAASGARDCRARRHAADRSRTVVGQGLHARPLARRSFSSLQPVVLPGHHDGSCRRRSGFRRCRRAWCSCRWRSLSWSPRATARACKHRGTSGVNRGLRAADHRSCGIGSAVACTATPSQPCWRRCSPCSATARAL